VRLACSRPRDNRSRRRPLCLATAPSPPVGSGCARRTNAIATPANGGRHVGFPRHPWAPRATNCAQAGAGPGVGAGRQPGTGCPGVARQAGRETVDDLSGAIPFWGRADSAASCDDTPARAGGSGKRVRLREAARELRPPPHGHGAAKRRRSPRSACPGVVGSLRREAPRERRGARARPGSTGSSMVEASPRLMASQRPRAPRAKRSDSGGPEGVAGPRRRWGFGTASRWGPSGRGAKASGEPTPFAPRGGRVQLRRSRACWTAS
jgi:hypothetical protein